MEGQSLDLEILVLITTSFSKNYNLRLNSEILLGWRSVLSTYQCHPCGFHVPYLKKKEKSLSFKQKGWRLGLHVQDADLQDTSSAHHLQKFTESFLACPWPCQECYVWGNQETGEAICCGSAFDQFPPSSCRSESNIACTCIFYMHTIVLNFGCGGTLLRNSLLALFNAS